MPAIYVGGNVLQYESDHCIKLEELCFENDYKELKKSWMEVILGASDFFVYNDFGSKIDDSSV